MDYEYRIKIAERELAHLREMQALHTAHMDVTDKAIEACGTIMERVESNLEKLTLAQLVTEQKLAALAEIRTRTEERLQSLIEVLLRGEGMRGE
jgi:hypothetical protein